MAGVPASNSPSSALISTSSPSLASSSSAPSTSLISSRIADDDATASTTPVQDTVSSSPKTSSHAVAAHSTSDRASSESNVSSKTAVSNPPSTIEVTATSTTPITRSTISASSSSAHASSPTTSVITHSSVAVTTDARPITLSDHPAPPAEPVEHSSLPTGTSPINQAASTIAALTISAQPTTGPSATLSSGQTATTGLPVVTASTPVSITVSVNGHDEVTAPGTVTAVVASVSGSSTSFFTAGVINPNPAGTLAGQNNLSTPSSFLDNKALAAGVLTCVALVIVAVVLFVIARVRRKKTARQQTYADTVYTNRTMTMTQHPNPFHPIVEPRMPSFEELPRPPPVPPRRRPVPEWSAEHPGRILQPLSLGTTLHMPSRPSTQYGSNAPPSSNPFMDPVRTSPVREMPFLHRPLKTPSNDGHVELEDCFLRPPSPAPSTPSLYPPSLPILDDRYPFGMVSQTSLHDDLAISSERERVKHIHAQHPKNPFSDRPTTA